MFVMSVVHWATRCIPGLSVLALLALIECALQVLQTSLIGLVYPTGLIKRPNPVTAQILFSAYTVTLHTLALLFPLRLCWAVWCATSAIQQAQYESGNYLSNKEKDNDGGSPRLRSKVDGEEEIVHMIIVPIYREEIETLQDTLNVLASHSAARQAYDVFLAMEKRDPNAASVATKLLSIYKYRFHDIQYSLHPGGLEGEAPGKSSNVGWAAREIQQKYSGKSGWKDRLVTVMDSDTHLLSNYFSLVTQSHVRNRKQNDGADMTLYMPPIVFDRNAHLVPRLVRSADLMWCGAGLSCYQRQPTRTGIGIPTSVYTLPLKLVSLAQGWDTGPNAIGEDMHMMLKCYFVTKGRLLVESIPSPASQCNVSSDKKGIRGYVLSHQARYTQALRHMWGCLDTGYTITQWWKMDRDPPTGTTPPHMPRKRRLSATELELKLLHYQVHNDKSFTITRRNFILLSRIFEAHFLPLHLMVLMFASTAYSNLSNPLVHCQLLTFALELTSVLRIISFLVMLLYFVFFYERYHALCIDAREAEMRRVGLYEGMEESFSHRRSSNPFSYLDFVIFPIAGTIFGSAPLLQAAFAHFVTEELVYKVSAKPKRKVAAEGVEKGKTGDV